LAEGIVAQVEVATFMPGPWDATLNQITFPPLGLKRAPIKYAVVGIDCRDELVLDVRLFFAQ